MKSARIANPNNLTALQLAVLQRFAAGGPTCDGWVFKHRHPGTIAKRRLELQLAGLVRDTGQQMKTPYGALAAVHEITPKGLRVLARYERTERRAA